ncbi:CHC2 zinc finger domain-containing protein [Candidatus Pacearchaeota archaeon]|jgi:DNA primase|nr:CHC2 zinc finger domain-containing protein [Candidatus Pacearchaeota archaeon]
MAEISINPQRIGLPEKALSSLCEQVKKSLPLEWIVESLVTDLKESDKGYLKGTCPFCGEKNLTLSRKHNVYYCFDCRKSGDVISFVARIKDISQIESLAYLYQLYGITTMNVIEHKSEAHE